MKRILYSSLALILMLLFLQGCREDPVTGEDDPSIPKETLATNYWIRENMSLYYLWNEFIPGGMDLTKEDDPEEYFYKLLYTAQDKWSNITDDYDSFKAEMDGDPVTMGYHPLFFSIGNNRIIIIVAYVYPGSAADEAGLKRGDIILSINNTALDVNNYYDFYSGSGYSVQLGRIENENTLVSTGQSVNLTARLTKTNPVIYHNVLDIDGHKIGYLVYVSFIAGEEDEFLDSLSNIFTGFKTAGISDLVVDLRYNPGGEISAAVHLASLIAPSTVVNNQEILIRQKYNTDLQAYLESSTDEILKKYLSQKFASVVANISMDKVYFLTTSRSASASELVIVSLEPYMDVVKIGEATYGKYTGAWVIPDDNEKWAMMPIVSKYANADGYTDFVNGLTPDHKLAATLFVAFGDTSDPMLAKAIELATGKSYMPKSLRGTATLNFRQVFPAGMMKTKTLLFPYPEDLMVPLKRSDCFKQGR